MLPTCALRSRETHLWNAVPEGLLLLETVYIYTICHHVACPCARLARGGVGAAAVRGSSVLWRGPSGWI